MKESKFKKHIEQNRSTFDSEDPSERLWDRIEADLPPIKNKTKMVSIQAAWKICAGVAAVVALGVFGIMELNNDSEMAHIDSHDSNWNNATEIESYYAGQVNTRLEKLKIYDVDVELLEEVALLKEEFELLKSEADKGLNQEDILDSMIDNYRLRVSILEEIMREVQTKSNNKKTHGIH